MPDRRKELEFWKELQCLLKSFGASIQGCILVSGQRKESTTGVQIYPTPESKAAACAGPVDAKAIEAVIERWPKS